MQIVMTCVLTFAGLIQALVQAHAQTMPAREAFEKYGLLGTYTIDCNKPVSASETIYNPTHYRGSRISSYELEHVSPGLNRRNSPLAVAERVYRH